MARHKSRLTTKTRLRIELLENRRVPTILTPTTFVDGGLGSGSLRDAILQFNADTGTADDTIQLLPGTYSLTIQNVGGHHETAGLTGDLNLTQTSHRWTIQGAGPSTIIDASQLQDRVFQIVNPGTQVVFQDLVIQGGLAQDNGADGAQAGTTDALGGGIFNNGGDITLDNVLVQNNGARGGDAAVRLATGYSALGGGIYSSGGALTLAAATLSNNQATGGRGGDSSRTRYLAGAGGSASGAGLFVSGGALDISDSTIANNRAMGGRGGDGGFYYTYHGTSTRTVFLGGIGGTGQGGGLYVNGGTLMIASSTIASNQGTGGPGGVNGFNGLGAGGGLYIFSNAGTPTVTGSTLSDNSAIDGGAIYNGGTLTVSDCTLSSNSAGRWGGAIYNGGTLTVSNSTLSGNNYASGGGGIYNLGSATVSNSTLSGNSAVWGGGIFNGDTLTVSNSTLSGNDGFYEGGGIYNFGTLTVSNSTLSGNTASGNGGGIDIISRRPVTLTNVTLTANWGNSSGGSGHGGGLFVLFSPPPVLHNTLIAGNFRGATGTTRDDVFGTLLSAGDYNLIGDGTGMTGLSDGVNGNQVGSAAAPINPLLGPLQDNGGPTKTIALLPGSPALNAGNPNQLGVSDQRGVIRTGGVNIGAYQASASAFVLNALATVSSGVPFDVTVTAVDPFGQVAVGYTGTITFSTSDPDPGVVLPADYTFTLDDGGSHTFTDTGLGETTLITPGDQTLTVMDTADNTITGSTTVTVDSMVPGSHGLVQAPPGRLPDSVPQASEPPQRQVVAVDWWFASVNTRDVGVILAQPIHHTEADWWALDPWRGDEPMFA
jgi:parallel beta-helix repeat protein